MLGIILILAGPLYAGPAADARGASVRKVDQMVAFIKDNRDGAPRRARGPKGRDRDFTLTEAEANAYAQYWMQDELQHGRHKEIVIKSAEIHFQPGHIVEADALVRVGVGSLKALNSVGGSFLARKLIEYLTVDNSAHLRCLVSAAQGKGFVEVQEARIKGIPIPASLIQEILKIVGEHQRPPRDFTKPIDLPNGIISVSVSPQELKLRVRPL